MISLFSQIIREHWVLEYKAKHRCKDVPAEVIPPFEEIIDENVNRIYPQVMWCHVISTLDYIAEKASCVYCTNEKVRKVGKWVCKNIVSQITKDNITTTNVKIRIAVDMLNKLENEGVISKELNLFYFDNIVTNCKDLWFDYNFGEDINKLPF